MYIEDWDTFFLQAQELQRKRPLHTRYCIKYIHKEGKLVLKVTDDVVVGWFCNSRRPWSLGSAHVLGMARVLMPGSVPAVLAIQDGSAIGY
jgi:hypothetical protein